jgi:hypothetical protein
MITSRRLCAFNYVSENHAKTVSSVASACGDYGDYVLAYLGTKRGASFLPRLPEVLVYPMNRLSGGARDFDQGGNSFSRSRQDQARYYKVKYGPQAFGSAGAGNVTHAGSTNVWLRWSRHSDARRALSLACRTVEIRVCPILIRTVS